MPARQTDVCSPQTHEPFTDKYFLRTKQILEAEDLNPWVRAEVFIRKGPGEVYGVDEALDILDTYTDLVDHGGKVYALREGDHYESKETLMVMEAPIQDIVELETMYLGVLAAETTKANDGHGVNLEEVTERMAQVVEAAGNRPVTYFGARHWRYDEDAAISKAAYDGGAIGASTDEGAATFGAVGQGTIPHALENIMAYIHGYDRAVVEATKAFDRQVDPAVPRIALIDYANREIHDAIETAHALEGRLYGVRVDTCGENVAQGAREGDRPYWEGNGVTVTGVDTLNQTLRAAGHEDVKVMLTSGFGDPAKVAAFVEAEQELGRKLFDGLGVGGVYEARAATMDIVAVGKTPDLMIPTAKIGREYRANDRLELRLGRRGA